MIAQRRKIRVATTSLAGCFGCHTSLLDMDERILGLLDRIELDRSPLTDHKEFGDCDVGIVEGGVCNAENVRVLRDMRAHCRILVAIGACALTGGLPAQRNRLDVRDCLQSVYLSAPGLRSGGIPADPELPLLLDAVHPVHDVVEIDWSLPGCPPPADAIFRLLSDLIAGRTPRFAAGELQYD